jgi:hypothetical protein
MTTTNPPLCRLFRGAFDSTRTGEGLLREVTQAHDTAGQIALQLQTDFEKKFIYCVWPNPALG